MAKQNMEMNDRSPLMVKQMDILKKISDEDPRVDYYRMCGTRKHGCRVLVDGTEIAEVWADGWKKKKDIEENNAGAICTKFVSVTDKAEAIDVGNREYDRMGERLFEVFAYHPEWGFKWSKWTRNLDDFYEVLIHIIKEFEDQTVI